MEVGKNTCKSEFAINIRFNCAIVTNNACIKKWKSAIALSCTGKLDFGMPIILVCKKLGYSINRLED